MIGSFSLSIFFMEQFSELIQIEIVVDVQPFEKIVLIFPNQICSYELNAPNSPNDELVVAGDRYLLSAKCSRKMRTIFAKTKIHDYSE